MVEFCIDPKPADQAEREFKSALRRLGYSHVEWFKMHIRWDDRLLEAFRRLKQQGLVRWLSVSFHASPEVIKRHVDSGLIDQIQISLNPTSSKSVLDLCAYCKSKGVAVIAMKTMAGGPGRWRRNPRLMRVLKQYFPNIRSIPQAIVKFVLSIPGVSSVVVACKNLEQLRDVMAGAGLRLTAEERRGLEVLGAAMRSEFCQLCGECEPACPRGLPVREFMRMELYLTAYGDRDAAYEVYKSLPRWMRPEACDGCGLCERACPQGVSVVERIRAVLRGMC